MPKQMAGEQEITRRKTRSPELRTFLLTRPIIQPLHFKFWTKDSNSFAEVIKESSVQALVKAYFGELFYRIQTIITTMNYIKRSIGHPLLIPYSNRADKKLQPKGVIWKENQQTNGCILIIYASPAMTHLPLLIHLSVLQKHWDAANLMPTYLLNLSNQIQALCLI